MSHKTTLGNFEISVFSDGLYYLDGGAMFGVVPKVLWEKRWRSIGGQMDDQNRIHLGMNSVLVRTGDHNVLIETGMGSKLDEKQSSFFLQEAKLLENLHAGGVAPEEIDVVINSHLHFDHCGWNTYYKDGKAVPTFPNATYYAQRVEWEHGQRQHERDRVSYISDNYNPLVESGQMRLLSGDAEIVPGISVKVRPGHTRSMQSVMIESVGDLSPDGKPKKACYISDLIPTTAHVDLAWVMGYDLFPLESIDNRREFYRQAIPEQWLVLFTHDPVMPMAYLSELKPGKLAARWP